MSSLGALSPTCRPARWPSAHDGLATIRAPGGVPERPKGTGCKPVGSAYGGSNPPAPTLTGGYSSSSSVTSSASPLEVLAQGLPPSGPSALVSGGASLMGGLCPREAGRITQCASARGSSRSSTIARPLG